MKANPNLILTLECTHPLVFGKKTLAVFSENPEMVTCYMGDNTVPSRIGVLKLSSETQERFRNYHNHNPVPVALNGELPLLDELEGEIQEEASTFFSNLLKLLETFFQFNHQEKQKMNDVSGMNQRSPFGTPNSGMYFNTLQQQIHALQQQMQMLMASVGSVMPPQPPFGNPSIQGFPNNRPQYFQGPHSNGVPSWSGQSQPWSQSQALTFATVVWKDEQGNYGQTIVDATGKNTEQLKEDFEKNFSMANSVTVATVVFHNQPVKGAYHTQ